MKRSLPLHFQPFAQHAAQFLSALALMLFALPGTAQLSVYVQAPEEISGPLEFSQTVDWGANLEDMEPVSGFLTLADDGTEADSLACEPLVNAAEMAGRIALLYRGICNFSLKAHHAQQAGAIAVVIVNNTDGALINMSAGLNADQVDIPVVMISQADGAMLRNTMATQEVGLLIGDLTGYFPYNLAFEPWGVLLPPAAAIPTRIAMGPEDLTLDLGAFIVNYGSAVQSNVRLQAQVLQEGNILHDVTSDPFSVEDGDTSIYVGLGQFSQEQYQGRYEIVYTILSDHEQAFPANAEFRTSMTIGETFSYSTLDPATGHPETGSLRLPSDLGFGWRSCIRFSHPNASRLAATGMYVNVSTWADSVFAGTFISVQANSWNANITAPNTLPAADLLVEEVSGDHFFTSEDDRGETVYVPFVNPVNLLDDQHYLFCLITNDPQTWHAWGRSDLFYDLNMDTDMLPVSNINIGADWYNLFTGVFSHPAHGVRMVDATGIAEHSKLDITPFPNPAVDQIRIPMAGQTGAATLDIYDLAGARVGSQRVNATGQEHIVVALNGISNGTYVFDLRFDNGRQANFRVVLSR
jgi:hypothetical protein